MDNSVQQQEEQLKAAEQVVVDEGKDLTPAEIRALLNERGFASPVVETVVSRALHIVRKVKSGRTGWDKEVFGDK
jgi:hypothetical protein